MLEYRFTPQVKVHADDAGQVVGVVMQYDNVATISGVFKEMFAPGVFGDIPALDCVCNFQHQRSRPLGRTGGGGLVLTDSNTQLTAKLTLPDTQDGRDCRVLLANGTLRGWSVEFRSERERFDDDVRVIEKASMGGVSLVDTPAHPASTAEIAKRFEMLKTTSHSHKKRWY